MPKAAVRWFACTAAEVCPPGIHTPPAVTYIIALPAAAFLLRAQTMVYAAVTARHDTRSRATVVGSAAGPAASAPSSPTAGPASSWPAATRAGASPSSPAAAVFALVFVSPAGPRGKTAAPPGESALAGAATDSGSGPREAPSEDG